MHVFHVFTAKTMHEGASLQRRPPLNLVDGEGTDEPSAVDEDEGCLQSFEEARSEALLAQASRRATT